MGRVRDSLLALFGYPTEARPEQKMDSMIATMSVRLRKCKGQVAIVLASQKRLQEQLHQNVNMVTQYQVKALAAVGRGEDKLARDLLRKKKRYQDTVKALEDQLRKHKRTSDSLMELVRKLELKLEETKRNKLLLLTQKEVYETSQAIEGSFEGEDGEFGFRDILDTLEEDVDSLRYQSEVGVDVEAEQLENEPDPLALPEGEEAEDDGAVSLDDELAALRETLQANPELLEEAQEAEVLRLTDDSEEDDEEEEDEEIGIEILATDGVSNPVEEDEEDEEEEEYEPPPPPPRRRKVAAEKAPPKKKRRKPPPPPEEDEEDEEDDDGIIFIS